MSTKRISKELSRLQKNKIWGTTVTLDGEDLHNWVALLPGPPGSPYEGSSFKLRITLPSNYPYDPPVVNFITPIYHLNVSADWGHVCMGITTEERWDAADGIEDVLNSLYAILQNPQPDNAADQSTLQTFVKQRYEYYRMARMSAEKAKET